MSQRHWPYFHVIHVLMVLSKQEDESVIDCGWQIGIREFIGLAHIDTLGYAFHHQVIVIIDRTIECIEDRLDDVVAIPAFLTTMEPYDARIQIALQHFLR